MDHAADPVFLRPTPTIGWQFLNKPPEITTLACDSLVAPLLVTTGNYWLAIKHGVLPK